MSKTNLAVVGTTAADALQNVRLDLKSRFYERDVVIDALLASLVARTHLLLLGPPGTAKSAVVNALTASIDGANAFSWLLTKFSTPEEVFGPVSLSGLQHDKFKRITTGKLPEAHVGLIDECFKASSSTLNALLGIVNERVFHNDGVVACPLITLVGCSNELPDDDESLEALFDRFLFRAWVDYLADGGNIRLLMALGSVTSVPATISIADLEWCSMAAESVVVSDAILDVLLAVKRKTESHGFRASDRRWRSLVGYLRAWAFVQGDAEVTDEHVVDVLPDCLWREPKDRVAIAAIVSSVANPSAARATEILDAAKKALAALGEPTTKDASEKAEWVMNASTTASSLEAMLNELDVLIAKGKAPKSSAVRKRVEAITREVGAKVASLYRL
ncbi:MAG: AAA family ATPase [Deltaproteobacteria bacterium]|nr:AAA family ATPase [Deltaproteobacteria bacterium]